MNRSDSTSTASATTSSTRASTELLRMQNGGCHPVDGCQDGTPFTGAIFQYLAANVSRGHRTKTILPAYEIKKVGNAKIAFIGMTLKGTPTIVTPAGIAGTRVQARGGDGERARAEARARGGVHGVRGPASTRAASRTAPYSHGYQDARTRTTTPSGDIIVDRAGGSIRQVDVVISAPHARRRTSARSAESCVTSAASFGPRRSPTSTWRIDRDQSKDRSQPRRHAT